MKKLLLSVIILSPLALIAQTEKNNIKFNVGPEMAYPIGKSNKTLKIGAGATIKAVVDLSKDVKWTFTTGFMSLKGKDIVISQSPKVVDRKSVV